MNYDLPFAFLYNIQGGQLLIIILAIVLLFGAKRLPELAKTFGKALHEFRKAASDVNKEIQQASTTATEEPKAESIEKSKDSAPAKDKMVV